MVLVVDVSEVEVEVEVDVDDEVDIDIKADLVVVRCGAVFPRIGIERLHV